MILLCFPFLLFSLLSFVRQGKRVACLKTTHHPVYGVCRVLQFQWIIFLTLIQQQTTFFNKEASESSSNSVSGSKLGFTFSAAALILNHLWIWPKFSNIGHYLSAGTVMARLTTEEECRRGKKGLWLNICREYWLHIYVCVKKVWSGAFSIEVSSTYPAYFLLFGSTELKGKLRFFKT